MKPHSRSFHRSSSSGLTSKVAQVGLLFIFVVVAVMFVLIIQGLRETSTDHIHKKSSFSSILSSVESRSDMLSHSNPIVIPAIPNSNLPPTTANRPNSNVIDTSYRKNLRQGGNNAINSIESPSYVDVVDIPYFEQDGWKFDLKKPADYVIGDKSIRDIARYHAMMKKSFGMNTVLLIMASNRPEYLHRCLEHVLRYHPRTALPIIISEDGYNPDVERVVMAAAEIFHKIAPTIPFLHLHHPPTIAAENGYIKLSSHFKWALTQVFSNPFSDLQLSSSSAPSTIDHVIILEEDLQISSDFYEYFASLVSLLDTDDHILAVSAWNDNGQSDFVKDPVALYRSDFFPGLGWMLGRKIWLELESKWPRGYWDDWLREPAQRKGRHIIRPEVCRTLHYGAHGVSNSQYSEYLNRIQLNQAYTRFFEQDLTYLQQENWEQDFLQQVRDVPIETIDSFYNTKHQEVSIRYQHLDMGRDSFVAVANWAGIMDNIKANVPRTAYEGIVTVWKNNIKLHIAPSSL